jgi:hypothetical protein
MYASENALQTRRAPGFLKSSAVGAKPQVEDDVVLEEIEADDPRAFSSMGIVELLLKDRWRLYRLLRVPAAPVVLLPRLLAISLAGYLLFGVTMSIVMGAAGVWPSLTPVADWIDSPTASPIAFEPVAEGFGGGEPRRSLVTQSFALIFAYAFGLVAASCVCLPSLYFYCLLAGVRMTMLDVVVHAVKSKAVAAVALVGILPIYVAIAMGVAIFGASDAYVRATMLLGLVLPFIAGIWGTVAMYQAFSLLCNTMPANRAKRRGCFLRRLVLSWSAIYTAVMPVMIYSVWEVLS